MFASQYGDIDTINLLLSKKINLEIKANNGYTALLFALTNKNYNIAIKLLELGASAHNIFLLKDISSLKILIDDKHIDINALDKKRTMLMSASLNCNIEAVNFLLDNGAIVNSKIKRKTAFNYALECKKYSSRNKILELLAIKGIKIDLNIVPNNLSLDFTYISKQKSKNNIQTFEKYKVDTYDKKVKRILREKWTTLNNQYKKRVFFDNKGRLNKKLFYENGVLMKLEKYSHKIKKPFEIYKFDIDKNVTYGKSFYKTIKQPLYTKFSHQGSIIDDKYLKLRKKPKFITYKVYLPNGDLLVERKYNKNFKRQNDKYNYVDMRIQKYIDNQKEGLIYLAIDLEEILNKGSVNWAKFNAPYKDKAIKFLDSIIKQVKKQITIKSNYTKKEAKQIMHIIGKTIYNYGIRYDYEHKSKFVDTLNNKKFDCDMMAYLYLTIGDKLNLPFKSVLFPEHVALIWKDSDYSFYWETTTHQNLSLNYYVTTSSSEFNIPSSPYSIKDGWYGYGKATSMADRMGAIIPIDGNNFFLKGDIGIVFSDLALKYVHPVSLFLDNNKPFYSLKKYLKRNIKLFHKDDLWNIEGMLQSCVRAASYYDEHEDYRGEDKIIKSQKVKDKIILRQIETEILKITKSYKKCKKEKLKYDMMYFRFNALKYLGKKKKAKSLGINLINFCKKHKEVCGWSNIQFEVEPFVNGK